MLIKFLRGFAKTVGLVVLLLTLLAVADYASRNGRKRTYSSALDELRALQLRERVRAWAAPGLAARQAAWNSAKAAYFLHKFRDLPTNPRPATEELNRFINAMKQLLLAETQSRLGMRNIVEEPGAKLRAYFSEIDHTLQTYSVTIPKVYDPQLSWPLIVSLHGHGWFRSFQGHPAPSYAGAFCLAPQGRGATDYKDLGELDVLRAIEEVKLDYNIDEDRIVLFGSSMGGTGSWHLGAHYPDHFSAIVPLAGNADYQAWTQRWGWNQWFPGRWNDLRRWLQEANTARAFSCNFSNLPVFAVHGSADTVVPPEHSREIVKNIRSFGGTVQYLESPVSGHGVPSDFAQQGLAWALGWSRETVPDHVNIRTDLMRHGRSYWLEIRQKEEPCEFAELSGEAVNDQTVKLTTVNVKQLVLERRYPLFNSTKPMEIFVDGARIAIPTMPESGTFITLSKDSDGAWQIVKGDDITDGLRKIKGLEGPISEALRAPFVLVVGTLSDSDLVRNLWADEARYFVEEWKRRNGGRCRLIFDKDCTAEIAAKRNLILFGGPRHNKVAAELADELPLQELLDLATEQKYSDHDAAAISQFEDSDLGLFTVYPNPQHRDRLVVMLAGSGPEAIYQAWQRFGNWFNWGVFDSRKYFDYAVYDARTASPESFLLLGYFGTDWSIANGQWYFGNDGHRHQFATQHFPPLANELPADYQLFKLVDVRPSRIDQMRGAIGLGRSFFGLPLPDSIGVRAPTVIEYNLNGFSGKFITGVRLVASPFSALTTYPSNLPHLENRG